MAAASASGHQAKTMFGVPRAPAGRGLHDARHAGARHSTERAEPAAPTEAAVAEADTGRTDRIAKPGARKVAVPAPAIVVVPAASPAKEVGRTTHYGFETAPKKVDEKNDKADKGDKSDKTKPTRAPAAAKAPTRQAPIWTYVGVGFTFGLALLGIYQLVGRLAH